MNRPGLRIFVGAFLVLVIAAGWTGLSAEEAVARVTFVRGDPQVMRGEELATADLGLELLDGDVIRTGEGERVTLLILRGPRSGSLRVIGSEEELKPLVAADPTDGTPYYLMGRELWRALAYMDAIREFRHYLELDQGNEPVKEILRFLYGKMDLSPGEVRLYREVVPIRKGTGE